MLSAIDSRNEGVLGSIPARGLRFAFFLDLLNLISRLVSYCIVKSRFGNQVLCLVLFDTTLKLEFKSISMDFFTLFTRDRLYASNFCKQLFYLGIVEHLVLYILIKRMMLSCYGLCKLLQVARCYKLDLACLAEVTEVHTLGLPVRR